MEHEPCRMRTVLLITACNINGGGDPPPIWTKLMFLITCSMSLKTYSPP